MIARQDEAPTHQ